MEEMLDTGLNESRFRNWEQLAAKQDVAHPYEQCSQMTRRLPCSLGNERSMSLTVRITS